MRTPNNIDAPTLVRGSVAATLCLCSAALERIYSAAFRPFDGGVAGDDVELDAVRGKCWKAGELSCSRTRSLTGLRPSANDRSTGRVVDYSHGWPQELYELPLRFGRNVGLF